MTGDKSLSSPQAGRYAAESGSEAACAFRLQYAGLSDRGCVRPENEDRWFADASRGVFIVADGIGGAAHGGLAAEIVVRTLPSRLHPILDRLPQPPLADLAATVSESLAQLSEQLEAESHGQPHLEGLGSTVVVAVVGDAGTVIGHLGDSRAYLARGDEVTLLTVDHSLLQLLLQTGSISAAEESGHPARSQLTRFVGMPSPALPDVRSIALRGGDRLLLCSDGVSGQLSDAELAMLLNDNSDPRQMVERIVAAANAAGGRDNSTAIVIAVEPVQSGTSRADARPGHC